LLTAARINWNFELARTAKNIHCKVQKRLKKCQHLLTTYMLTFVIIFVVNAFINVCYFDV